MKYLALTFLFPLSILAQNKADSIKTLDYKLYKITYPATWKAKETCLEKECSIVAPSDTLLGGLDTYLESINFTYNALTSADYTADKYADYSLGYLPKVVKNFKLVERKKLKPNVVRVTYKGEKNQFQQTWRQYYYVKSGKIFIVTFSAETSKYAVYQPFIEPYLNSFVLK